MPATASSCTVDWAPSPDGSSVLMAIRGEFDLQPADAVEDHLRHLREHKIPTVVDLRDLRFVDSYGTCVLLRAAVSGRRDGWDLQMLPPSGRALEVLELCEVDRVLPFVTAAR